MRHLDAENDEQVEHVVDSRMQRDALVDQQHLQQLLASHQTTLDQTKTGTLTTIQKEKDNIHQAFTTERQKLVANQQAFLDDVDSQYKTLKDKLSADIAADFLSYRKMHHENEMCTLLIFKR